MRDLAVNLISIPRILLGCLIVGAALTAHPVGDLSTSDFISTSFSEITEHSFNFELPLAFVLPADYVVVPMLNNSEVRVIMSPADLKYVNENGGRIDYKQAQQPMLQCALSLDWAYRDGKFSVESEPVPGFSLERGVWHGTPVLRVENPEKRFYLVLMAAGEWVYVVSFIPAAGLPEDLTLWKKFLTAMEKGAGGTRTGKLSIRKIEPDFGDGPLFKDDIALLNREAVAVEYDPKINPQPGKTTETEIYAAFPVKAIQRRYSFPNPVTLVLSGRSVTFDRWIAYGAFRQRRTDAPGVTKVETLETLDVEAFIRKGILVHFVVHHKIRKGERFENGPLALFSYERRPHDANIVQIYSRMRGIKFRKFFQMPSTIEDLLPEKQTRPEINMDHMALGELPVELASFQKLEKLSFAYNQLRHVRCESLPGATLKELGLYENDLTELPACFGNLQQLTRIGLSENRFTVFPAPLYALKNLSNLFFRGNRLRSFPAGRGAFPALREIDLSENELEEFPAVLLSAGKLRDLDLRKNRILKIPRGFAAMTELDDLNLSGNRLTEWPRALEELPAIRRLDLAENRIKAVPASVGKLSTLISLDLGGNQIETLPKEIGTIKGLYFIGLEKNRVKTFPRVLVGMPKLFMIRVGDNELETIPDEIFRIPSVELSAANNRLTKLPAFVCDRPGPNQPVRFMHLQGNRFPEQEKARLRACSGVRFHFSL